MEANAAITAMLAGLTALALIATASAVSRLLKLGSAGWQASYRVMTWVLLVGSVASLVAAVWGDDTGWQPLNSHLDGLLLIAALLLGAVLFLDVKAGLPGLSAFILPLVSFVLAWSVCAYAFTRYFFDMGSVWRVVHVLSAYPGTLCALLAGAAGVMYLAARHRLKHVKEFGTTGPLPSLETVERLLVRAAAATFVLLSIAMVVGALDLLMGPSDERAGAVKVASSALAWVAYGLLLYRHRGGRLRGAPTAWLALAGMVLLILTITLSTLVPSGQGVA